MRPFHSFICVIGSAIFLQLGIVDTARAETTFFPNAAFGVAGPIPTPGNIRDLVGMTSGATSVQFDPGDLGFLRFDVDITGVSTGMMNANLFFNIISALPSAAGSNFISVTLGNIASTPFGGLSFTQAAGSAFTAPDGSTSIFQFTQVTGTGVFEVDTSAFLAGCATIGGCNTIVIGTSGLGAAGGSSFTDGGTLTFSSVVAATPEPAMWFLMISGFLLIAWQTKRKRNFTGLQASKSAKDFKNAASQQMSGAFVAA